MFYLEQCTDFEILKANLTLEQLEELEKVLELYLSYEYVDEFVEDTGKRYVADWYESLISTDELLDYVKEWKL